MPPPTHYCHRRNLIIKATSTFHVGYQTLRNYELANLVFHIYLCIFVTCKCFLNTTLLNMLARIVVNQRGLTRASPILHKLHWLPVKYRFMFKVATIILRSYCSFPYYIQKKAWLSLLNSIFSLVSLLGLTSAMPTHIRDCQTLMFDALRVCNCRNMCYESKNGMECQQYGLISVQAACTSRCTLKCGRYACKSFQRCQE